jgi:hypothetical protein
MNIFYLFGGLLLLICFAGVLGSVGVLLFGCLKKKGTTPVVSTRELPMRLPLSSQPP